MRPAPGREIGAVVPKVAVSKIGRLTQRADFLAAAGGRRFHTERFSAQGRLRGDDASKAPDGAATVPVGLRIGFTITKRVGHATERNRIRRRLRAALRATADDLPSPAADIVLIARRPALSAGFETLIEDLRRAVPVVTKPQTRKDPAAGTPGSGPRRGRGKSGSGKPASGTPASPGPAAGASPTMPLLASGPGADASSGRATAPSPIPNACDGSTDG
jgi:ribonuclease P protein component